MHRLLLSAALTCTAAVVGLSAAERAGEFALRPAAEQAPGAPATQTREDAIFLKFRDWIGQQPRAVQESNDVLDRYRAKLAADGVPAADIAEAVRIIEEQGEKLEIDRWNRILTSPNARFNREPNAFLVRMIKGRKPGTALDVGMGQGRNAIYLAAQGWTVTGFDPADAAVAAARKEAARQGLTLTTTTDRDDTFDWGRNRWDLIVMSYVDVRTNVRHVLDSLRPGGIVVVEGFHRDATREGPIGGAVVFDTNELLTLFAPLRVLDYEDTDGVSDFGMSQTRVVRLCAQKP